MDRSQEEGRPGHEGRWERHQPLFLSTAFWACWLQPCPWRASLCTSRCGLRIPPVQMWPWVSSLEHLWEAPPTHTPHTSSQAREGAHLQATEIVLLWPLGARLTLVMSCLGSKAGDPITVLSSWPGSCSLLLPCHCGCGVSLVTCPAES